MAQSSRAGTGVGDVRNLLGFLVIGFAGVLNVIGVKSAEIGVILRNDPGPVSYVAIILLVGVIAATASVFVDADKHAISLKAAVIVLFVMLFLFCLTVWIVGERGVSLLAFLGVACVGSFLPLIWDLRTKYKLKKLTRGSLRKPSLQRQFPELLNLQCLLLVAAVSLTSTAAYGALQIESLSQASVTVPTITDTLHSSGHNYTLSASASVSKLETQWLGVYVFGVPRSINIVSMCSRPKMQSLESQIGVGCDQDPCLYLGQQGRPCTGLAEGIIPPDATGQIDRTIEVPFSDLDYDHIQIRAALCEAEADGNGLCGPIGPATRLDITIP
jgi:hypothetical protein